MWQTTATSRGTAGLTARSPAGASVAARAITSRLLSPANGRTPASASYSMTPSAHTSAGGPTSRPRACSGAMYAGVPTTDPVRVRSAASARLASPKSATFAVPAASNSTLAGFRSRWTTPTA